MAADDRRSPEVDRLRPRRAVDTPQHPWHFNPVGGNSWATGYDLLGPTGRLVAYGFSAASGGNARSMLRAATPFLKIRKYDPLAMMGDNRSIAGVNMGHLFGRLDILTPQFQALMTMFDRGLIGPHFDRVFRFDEAPAAHQDIHDRKARGKVPLVA